jgi:hypothetical protein
MLKFRANLNLNQLPTKIHDNMNSPVTMARAIAPIDRY